MSQPKEFVTNSKRIHEKFDISHKKVLVAIDKILQDNPEFFNSNFIESTFISRQNKELRCFDMTNDGAIYLVMGMSGQKAMKWKESFISNVSALEEASFEMINVAADITEQLGYCYVIESVGGLVKVGKSFSHPKSGRVKSHENTLGIFGDSVKDVKIFKPKSNQDKNALETSLINYIKANCEKMMTKEWCMGVDVNKMIEDLKLKEFK